MNVLIFQEQTLPHFDSQSVINAVREVVFFEGKSFDEVALHFVDPDIISEIHQQYFNDPSVTDCISFPVDEDDSTQTEFRLMGDVFVCPQTALDYSQKHEIEYHQEVTLYVVHGLLHLMGYDDIHESDELNMRQAELRHIIHLKEKSYLLKEGTGQSTGATS